MHDFAGQRASMVERQLVRRKIRNQRVLDAMGVVPREEFVADDLRSSAYEDSALPIEAGQTISQPYIVARMIEAAELSSDDRILEIGAGSGYAAAVMSGLAHQVYTIERHAELGALAQARFDRLGYSSIRLRVGDGTEGWPEAAPFDAILAAASGPAVPAAWRRQLKIGGRLVMPLGENEDIQRLVKIVRTGNDAFREEKLCDVRFVPLISND